MAGCVVVSTLCLATSAAAQITEFPVPDPDSRPTGITAGPDGALWFTEADANQIGRITTSGTVTEFAIPTPGSQPTAITAGPDGALWFIENAADKIGRITTAGEVAEYPIPTPGSFVPRAITAGPDGALWFTDVGIGRMTTDGSVTEFPLPEGWMVASSITSGPDGALWYTASDRFIGRITTSGEITQFETPTSGRPSAITAGPDGALWFTQPETNAIGRITTGGAVTEFPVPTPRSNLGNITTGPDGALWFTEVFGDKIGRITPSGMIGEIRLPAQGSWPAGITAGPDGAIWFTELQGNRIGRIPASALPPEDRVVGILHTEPPCTPGPGCSEKPRYVFDVSSALGGEDAQGTVTYEAGERFGITIQQGAVTCLFTDQDRATVGVNFAAAAPGAIPARGAVIFLEDGGPGGADRFAVQELPAGTAPSTCPADPPPPVTLGPGYPPGVTIADVQGDTNQPPSCVGVVAAPDRIALPSRRLVGVKLTGASDPDGDALSFRIDGVTQDEPVKGAWSGDHTSPDARLTLAGRSSRWVRVRAERSPFGDGRVYHIAFTVTDAHGAICSDDASVAIPRRWFQTAVDSAPPSYNSFGAALP